MNIETFKNEIITSLNFKNYGDVFILDKNFIHSDVLYRYHLHIISESRVYISKCLRVNVIPTDSIELNILNNTLKLCCSCYNSSKSTNVNKVFFLIEDIENTQDIINYINIL